MRTPAPALALLAGSLALAGCGGGGGKSTATTAPPTTTTAAKPTAPTTILPATTTTTPPRTTTRRAVVTTPEGRKPVVIDIQIVGGQPVGGIKRVTVEKPQLVDLVVHSDVADEVHLHGYDLHQDVQARGTARIRFQAKIQGVFEAELENRKLQILELTVK